MKQIAAFLAVFIVALWIFFLPLPALSQEKPTCSYEVYFPPHGGCTESIIREVMIIDGETVVTGSFNFTKAAEENNAENLLVIRDRKLAERYIENWQDHDRHSEVYTGRER